MLTFNLHRVKALFMREFRVNFLPMIKVLSIIVLVVFILNAIGAVVDSNNGDDDDITANMIRFSMLLLLGGFIYASLAFNEFAKTSNKAGYLALPGSSLEKISVKWLLTNPLFILTASILFLIIATVFSPIFSRFGGEVYQNEIFFSRQYWIIVGIFFIVHSVFFFGSIAFDRYSFIKTLAALLVIAFVVAILNLLFFRIVWADMFESLFEFRNINGNLEFGNRYEDPSEMWQVQFFIFAFKYLLAPVLWAASLFKLTEKEV